MQRVWNLISRAGARTVIAVPYIWLLIFFGGMGIGLDAVAASG